LLTSKRPARRVGSKLFSDALLTIRATLQGFGSSDCWLADACAPRTKPGGDVDVRDTTARIELVEPSLNLVELPASNESPC
jgi:hypothetical protein